MGERIKDRMTRLYQAYQQELQETSPMATASAAVSDSETASGAPYQ